MPTAETIVQRENVLDDLFRTSYPIGLSRDVIDEGDVAKLAFVEITAFADQYGQHRLRGQIVVQRKAFEIGRRQLVDVFDMRLAKVDAAVLCVEQVRNAREIAIRFKLRDQLQYCRFAFIHNDAIGKLLEELRQLHQFAYKLGEYRSTQHNELPVRA